MDYEGADGVHLNPSVGWADRPVPKNIGIRCAARKLSGGGGLDTPWRDLAYSPKHQERPAYSRPGNLARIAKVPARFGGDAVSK